MTLIYKTLLDILESHSFERLEPFKQKSVWNQFAQEERILFARLLVLQGSQQLSVGHQEAFKSFEFAAQISCNSPEILYQQGSILSSFEENIRCLHLASEAFASALKQNPSYSKAWIQRAEVLTQIGIFEGETAYFVEAHENFGKALPLIHASDENLLLSFYWKWGKSLVSLGKISGEPSDYHQAIEKFKLSYSLGCQSAPFLNDFALAFVELSHLLDKASYLNEGLKLFYLVVEQDPSFAEGWFNLACCQQSLIELNFQEKDLLDKAEESFIRAAELNPHCGQLWFKWAKLEAAIGKLKHDPAMFEDSFFKFSTANELESGNPQILSGWAESELFLGVQEGRCDLIHSACSKIITSIEIQPEDPDSWYIYASCLYELGEYFNDISYYEQAIEKFHHGLSLSRQHPLLWYGLALSQTALGDFPLHKEMYEKSDRSFSRALECMEIGFPQFYNDWGVALIKIAEETLKPSYVEMAIEKFELALKQPVQNLSEEDVDLEWVYNYGCAYDLLGELKEESCHYERSIQILNQILQLDPEYLQARFNLALAFAHLAEDVLDVELYQKAIEHFEYLLQNDAEDEMVHLNYGVTLTNLGLLVHDFHHPDRSQTIYRQAEGHLMQAAALGNMQSYYQLAGLYSLTGHFENAMHYLGRAQFFNVLPDLDDLLHDEWLEGVRHIPAFRQFINELPGPRAD